ncbi:MAG: hypothetical protein EB023_06210 [Flavobacteriia bacterium]|nr:hypothetical protein [Flavobacteriia bacterium]
MTLKVGKLYSCSEYYLMLYPDKETAAATLVAASGAAAGAAAVAAYWSKKFGNPVSYCNPQTLLLVLSVKEKYVEVLAEDKKGWIIYQDWSDIGEITDAAA